MGRSALAARPTDDLERRARGEFPFETGDRMMQGRPSNPQLDIQTLPPDVATALEAAMAGEAITLVRSGQTIGVLEFRSHVLTGTVVESPEPPTAPGSTSNDVTVVATAMKLSKAARGRLSDEFGTEYIVLDLPKAPPTTDVLLVNQVSPQLLGLLRQQFPQARIVIVEIEDEELGVDYGGPVGRMLDAGANAYLPSRPIAQVAAGVHAYLAQDDARMLEAGGPKSTAVPALTPAPVETEADPHRPSS